MSPCYGRISTGYVFLSRQSSLFYICMIILHIIYIYVCIYVLHVYCVFYSVTGHHGRTACLNGPPCINIFEIKKK